MCAGTLCPSHPLVLMWMHTFSNASQHPWEHSWTSPWVDLMAGLTMVKPGAAVVNWVPDRDLLPSALGLVSVDILQPNITHSLTEFLFCCVLPFTQKLAETHREAKRWFRHHLNKLLIFSVLLLPVFYTEPQRGFFNWIINISLICTHSSLYQDTKPCFRDEVWSLKYNCF